MKKMANGEPLGPPGRPGKGSYLERLQNEGKDPRKKKKQHMSVEGPTKKIGDYFERTCCHHGLLSDLYISFKSV